MPHDTTKLEIFSQMTTLFGVLFGYYTKFASCSTARGENKGLYLVAFNLDYIEDSMRRVKIEFIRLLYEKSFHNTNA